MTEENYNYRTSNLFLRNQFNGTGEFNIPIIPKQEFSNEELFDLLLIGFDKIKNDKNNFDRMVHFFLYDYKFENIWKKPDVYIEKLKKYKAVLSPDFSMYIEMNKTLQLYNTFRNRWCGAYLTSKGIKVVPTVNWGNEDTFAFCFEAIPKESIVAVSTYMVHEHGNHSDQKEFFMKGYNEMLKRIEPSKIICYSEPFSEMQGDIIYVDYELTGWKYLKGKTDILINENKSGRIIHKTIAQPEDILKGTGSAYGGEWKPKKPDDERFLGEPGEIKESFDKNGERRQTKIGDDGRAEKERHFSNHNRPDKHTNPHDHKIDWDPNRGNPLPGAPINYPDLVPDFKSYKGVNLFMPNNITCNEEDRFKTISDFKWCIDCGGEVEFRWKNKLYSITHPEGRINIGEGCYEKDGKYYNVNSHTEYSPDDDMWGDTADEILEYIVDGDRLRDVITQIEVIVRTI
jgi:hypothetical protein